MSQAGRKDFTSSVSDTLTPDSQKSTGDQAKDKATGAYDSVAGSLQPESQKSTGQKVGDSLSSGKGSAEDQSGGLMQSAQDTFNSASQSVSDALGGSSMLALIDVKCDVQITDMFRREVKNSMSENGEILKE